MYSSLFLFFLSWFLLARLFYGLLPCMRADTLKNDDIDKIKANGISHNTSNENYKKIIESGMIMGHGGLSAYSNLFRKSAFFFLNEDSTLEDEVYNGSHKFQKKIVIKNISDEQISKMKIRHFDNSIIVCGDFYFSDTNEVTNVELNKSDYRLCGKAMKAFLYQVITAVIAFVLITILAYIIKIAL